MYNIHNPHRIVHTAERISHIVHNGKLVKLYESTLITNKTENVNSLCLHNVYISCKA